MIKSTQIVKEGQCGYYTVQRYILDGHKIFNTIPNAVEKRWEIFLKLIYLFLRERERKREQGNSGERRRQRIPSKILLIAQSPRQGSNS